MTAEHEAIRAINSLSFKRLVVVEGRTIEIVLLVHPEAVRPMTAGWWSGKEASIIGADVTGNFFLRQSSGAVGYWHHAESRLAPVAPSVRDFIALIH